MKSIALPLLLAALVALQGCASMQQPTSDCPSGTTNASYTGPYKGMENQVGAADMARASIIAATVSGVGLRTSKGKPPTSTTCRRNNRMAALRSRPKSASTSVDFCFKSGSIRERISADFPYVAACIVLIDKCLMRLNLLAFLL